MIGGPNFYDAHPDEAYYLFVRKDKYYFITLGGGDYTRGIVNKWKPRIENITIRIKKNNKLSEEDVCALIQSFKIEEKSGYHEDDDFISFKIYYNNILMLKEF